METLLLYLIGAVGCTVVLTMSSICAPIRRAGCRSFLRIGSDCFLYCSMCRGLGVGTPIVFGTIAFSTSVLSHITTWWLRSRGHFTEPRHDGWKIGSDGTFRELD